MILRLFIFLFSFLFINPTYAVVEDKQVLDENQIGDIGATNTAAMLRVTTAGVQEVGDWCIQDPVNPPCNGAPGRCTIHSDGSLGGFVADTAIVGSVDIGLHASVCETAQVTGTGN